MINQDKVKLGKLPARHDRRVPLLSNFMDHLSAAPPIVDWTQGRSHFAMLGNDQLGNCTSCAMAHLIGITAGASGRPFWEPSKAQAVAEYSKSAGYTAGKPETDQGAVEADVLACWHAHGYCGWTIKGYGRITLGDMENLRKCIWLLGGCYIGFGLPPSARHQQIWSVPAGGPVRDGQPRSWGGHACLIARYDTNKGLYGIVTWDGIHQADGISYSLMPTTSGASLCQRSSTRRPASTRRL